MTATPLMSEEPTSTRSSSRRGLASVALVLALSVAVWTQRSLVAGAVDQMRSLSLLAVGLLIALAAYERWSRADIVRRLIGDQMSIGSAVTVHDVGTAVSKGVPLGGALGTAIRWSIVRESNVAPARFATMLIAYGIATTFVSWVLPFAALSADLTQRSADLTDVVILCGIGLVVTLSAVFWTVVLSSDRLEGWAARRISAVWARLARRITALEQHDPSTAVADVRRELAAIARRPWSLLGRSMAAQACGSVILLVALRSIGVGDDLGVTEFFRLFFITHLLGTFAPTPGGVGVVEAGMTGALVAAGVEAQSALAAVLVYRFLTYVVPIIFGAALYLVWRTQRARRAVGQTTAERAFPVESGLVGGKLIPSVTLAVHGPSIDTAVPFFPRAQDQRVRKRRHSVRDRTARDERRRVASG